MKISLKKIKYSEIGLPITTSIKFSTLHQIVKDLKRNYFIYKKYIVIYQNEIDEFKDINHIAEKFWFHTNIIYSISKRRWVLIIGEREKTSNKTYNRFNKIYKEVINKIE